MNKITVTNKNEFVDTYGEIPDLWHVSQYLDEKADDETPESNHHKRFRRWGREVGETWHQLHALRPLLEAAYKQDPTAFDALFNGKIKFED